MAKRLDRDLLSLEGLALLAAALIITVVLYVLTFGASDTAHAVIGGTAIILLLVVSGSCLAEGLITGVVRAPFARPSRTDAPLDFWWATGMWAGLFSSTVLLLGAVALDLLNV